jgi:hypothetical protein
LYSTLRLLGLICWREIPCSARLITLSEAGLAAGTVWPGSEMLSSCE